MNRLYGKNVIITGAGNGIGLAAAELFAAEGAKLLLVDRDTAALAGLADRLGPQVHVISTEVSEPSSAERYTAEARDRFGWVNAAILNAGIEGEVAPLGKASLAAFDRVMAVNVRSVFLGLSALMPAMAEAGGSIIITSSTGGMRGTPNLAAYGASKHAVIGLMRAAAREGAGSNIRVNTVNPGPIDTRMIAAINAGREPADPDAARRSGIAGIPMQRYGRASEVAAVMLFLASDESSFVTGSIYPVDGGLTA